MRAAAVSASCAVAMIHPSASTGHTSMRTSETKATSPPIVSDPLPTANAPAKSTPASVRLGTSSIADQNTPSRRTRSSDEPRSSAAWRAKPSPTRRRRPKALMMRMPVAVSSTNVARSPVWSCTRRETAM